VVGRKVMIPDFIAIKGKKRVYIEIMGFWTPEYIQNKLEKLEELGARNFIIIASETNACKKLRKLKNAIIFKKRIPIKEVLNILKKYESEIEPKIELGNIISLENKNLEDIKYALGEKYKEYVKIGHVLYKKEIIERIRKEDFTGDYATAIKKLEKYGIRKNYAEILEYLGYEIKWKDLIHAYVKKKNGGPRGI